MLNRSSSNLKVGDGFTLTDLGVGGTDLLDAQAGNVVAGLDTAGGILDTLSIQAHETATESITSAIGINNIVHLGNREHGNSITDGNNSLLRALSDHDSARTGVTLGQLSQLLGDLLDILSFPACGLGVGAGLILVTKEQISVLDDSIQTLLEELRNERSAQVQSKHLVVIGSVLRNSQSRSIATIVGQEERTKVVVLCLLDDSPVLGLLQEFELELFGSGQVGDEGTVKGKRMLK